MRRRFIVERGPVIIHTDHGEIVAPLWIGVEIEGPVPIEFLSRCGFQLTPADHMEPETLASLGVEYFEEIDFGHGH